MALPSGLTNPQGEGFHAELDELYLRVAATPNSPARIVTRPVATPKVDTSTNPEDLADDIGSAFSRNDFQGGDGLLLAHRIRGDQSDNTRYKTGQGIDVWADDPGDRATLVTLTQATEQVDTNATQTSTIRAGMTFVGGNDPYLLYVDEHDTGGNGANGVKLVTVDRLDQTTDSVSGFWTVKEYPWGPFGRVDDLATMGDEAYALNAGLGVTARANGSWNTYANDSTLLAANATRLWSAKSRLVAAGGRQLVDVVPSAVTGDSIIMATGGGNWVGVADAGAFVLAANTDGFIYAFTYNPQDSSWVVQAQSPMGEGNRPTCIGSAHGRVYVGTEVRTGPIGYVESLQQGTFGAFWEADIGDDGALVNKDRVRTWPDTTPRTATPFKDDIYIYAYPDIWRYDPINKGLHRHLTVTAPTSQAEEFRDVRIAGVRVQRSSGLTERLFINTAGQTSSINQEQYLYASKPDEYLLTGTIELPLADFYSAEQKVWLELTAVGAIVDPATRDFVDTGNSQIYMYVAALDRLDTDPNWLLAGVVKTSNSMKLAVSLAGELLVEALTSSETLPNSRYIAIRADFLNADDHLKLPALLSVSVRGVTVADERQYQVPVNVSDLIERPYRKPFRIQGQGELLWQALKAKEGTQVALEMYRPSVTVEGVLVSVDTPIIGYTPRGSATTVSVLTIRGKES